MTYKEAEEKLKKYDQLHVLKYYDELNKDEKDELLSQIESLDFSSITDKEDVTEGAVIEPIDSLTLNMQEKKKADYTKQGISMIQDGKVGAVLLAGGMGTRLGCDGPKGVVNIGITKEVYIFERIISNLTDTVRMAGKYIHLFVMTSDKNHDDTTSFFEEKNYFGYPKEYVHFFKQEMAPATDYNKKVFLESRSKISTSPNGNGGWFQSMIRTGMTDIIKDNGIEWLNIFAVDNVLQRICDPAFVGAVSIEGKSSGAKVVRKANKHEKVGVMCLRNGKPSIVEYYDLSEQMADEMLPNGEPAYNFGVILNYLFNVKELTRISNSNLRLHVVEKKIPYMSDNGEFINPETPNGYKYEMLVLDMIEMFPDCLVYEVVREKEFAPIKNKVGADSVDTARELLKMNGVEI